MYYTLNTMPDFEEITPQELEKEGYEERKSIGLRKISWLSIQTVFCAAVLAVLLIFKFFIPAAYSAFQAWYDAEMECSVIIEYDDNIPIL